MADDIEIKLNGVRLSFLHVFEPQERRDDKTKELNGYNYNCAILVPKADKPGEKPVSAKMNGETVTGAVAVANLIKQAMKKAKDGTWGDSPPRFAPDQLPLRDGEPPEEEGGPRKPLYDGYEGMYYISANRPVKVDDQKLIESGKKKVPVKVIGPRKNVESGRFEIITSETEPYAPYSGCFANVVIRIYGYVPPANSSQKARINASLEVVQFVRDGERFGARGVDVDNVMDEEDVDTDDIGGGAAPATPAADADEFAIG